MVIKCCVPGCRTNYEIKKGERTVTCFTFPIEEQLKEKWLRKIPRHNLKVSKHTVVCIKHFRESDVIKNDVLPGKHGKPDSLILRKKFACQKDAVPCIFPNLPSYLSSSTGSVRRCSPSKSLKKIEEAHHNLQQEWIDQDKIFSYVQLVGNLNEHLQSFKHSALCKSSEKELLLYQIKIPSNGDSPFLSFSLRVTESLEVNVWLNGIRLISSDLGWLQMQDNKISH